jgi:ubiquinone/menaquinone biosynthesis C-methylase UbiE
MPTQTQLGKEAQMRDPDGAFDWKDQPEEVIRGINRVLKPRGFEIKLDNSGQSDAIAWKLIYLKRKEAKSWPK